MREPYESGLDYLDEEGLLRCGKCHDRKQRRISWPRFASGNEEAATRVIDRRCRCEQEQYEKEQEALRQEEHTRTVNRLRQICFTDLAMHAYTFDTADKLSEELKRPLQIFVDHWDEMYESHAGLLLWGRTGNGKSTAAACIANALIEREIRVLMRNAGSFLNSSFEDREELLREVADFDLLILDDVGMERGTEYGLEMLFQLIDTRYNSRKPTIITTNLSLSTLKNPTDLAHERIYSRILEMCTPIQFSAESIRPLIHKERLQQFRKLVENDTEIQQLRETGKISGIDEVDLTAGEEIPCPKENDTETQQKKEVE